MTLILKTSRVRFLTILRSFYDLNDLRMKKSKYVILSVALKSEEDLSFSFSFDRIEILRVESFFQHEVVNIFSTLV